ncbi:hypothetical protein E4U17_006151 [Claviceps sp. LM77 group G4]|nr:hypothetical protein E4U17_006151 [Claviceps sp. LM77 group G4]KAG6082103.1 hypothetical protein E4U33_006008 [Claviceps sp. LM78 group G4]KAG6083029.1 hypothetical protein E4U16_005049 [Claviceps sp. LM84 group G4]
MSDLASYRSTNQPTALSHWVGQNSLVGPPPLPANPAASGSDIESNTKPEKAGAARELLRQVASLPLPTPEKCAVDKRSDTTPTRPLRQAATSQAHARVVLLHSSLSGASCIFMTHRYDDGARARRIAPREAKHQAIGD